RGRHTIFDCDWSSDVCSSDLGEPATTPRTYAPELTLKPSCAALVASSVMTETPRYPTGPMKTPFPACPARMRLAISTALLDGIRSEERRVGKVPSWPV